MEYILSTVCSGIGSPEQAAAELSQETGIKHKIGFYCEINRYARASYEANFEGGFFVEDMTKEEWDGPEFYSDIFIGGIPCQAFSLAGLRKGELDPRGLLFYDFYRYVKKQQPKAFIIENVKGLLSDSNGKTFQNWLHLLGTSVNGHHKMFNSDDALSYNLHWTVLNTKDFGVPQNRERVFIVGIRDDIPNTFRFPATQPLKLRLKDILEPVVDEKYYLSDKMLNGFLSKGGDFGERFSPKSPEDVGNCVTARLAKMAATDNYIKEPVKTGFINQDSQASAVYDIAGETPAICAGTHGYAMGYIEEINNKDGLTQFGSSQDSKLSPLNGLSQCLSSGNFNQPKILVGQPELILAGNLNQPGHNESTGRVYSASGLSPTITAKQGGGHEPKILEEKVLVSKERRTAEAKAEAKAERRQTGSNSFRGKELTFEPSDTMNCLQTGLTNDHLIAVPEPSPVLNEHRGHLDKEPRFITDGIVPTLRAESHGHETKVVVKEATKKGYAEAHEGDSINLSNPNSTTPRGRVGEQIANTLDTACNQAAVVNHRIRRLTPLECWRLQGFPDENFYKAQAAPMSDSQLYRQAGNSMSVPVMKGILKNIVKCIM